MEVEYGLVADAGAPGGVAVDEEGAGEGAGEGSPGERRDAEGAGEEQAAEDDAERVDQRGDALVGELLANESDGGEDTAGEEEDLAGEEDAGHLRAERGLLGAGGEEALGVDGRQELGEQDDGAEHEQHGVEDDGEGAVAGLVLAALAVAAEDGDEADGGGASDEEVGDQVRELEGDIVGVGARTCAEGVGDVFVADETDDAGEEGEAAEEYGCGACRVLVRGPEKAEAPRGRRVCGGNRDGG